MPEIITSPQYGQQYYTCELCGDIQIFVFSVTTGPGRHAVMWADAASIEHLELWKFRDWDVEVTECAVPGKASRLCNHCWKYRREEAFLKVMMK